MNLDGALVLARRGELYPGVILHGGSAEERRTAALQLGRTLLCERGPDERPCGACRHCRRIVLAGAAGEGDEGARGSADAAFHPDFQVLERDLKASTSVEATKTFLRTAQVSPFEARGQVFVVASAESLSGEAANALLKTLEEPHTSAPRHFFLLAPSRLDLLATLRSRCLSVYLGGALRPPAEEIDELAGDLGRCFAAWSRSGAQSGVERGAGSGSAAWLLAAAALLEASGDFSDLRSGAPWSRAAAAVVAARERPGVPPELSPRLLALAEDLLRAPAWRLRAVPAGRILDGLVARHLTRPPTSLGTPRRAPGGARSSPPARARGWTGGRPPR